MTLRLRQTPLEAAGPLLLDLRDDAAGFGLLNFAEQGKEKGPLAVPFSCAAEVFDGFSVLSRHLAANPVIPPDKGDDPGQAS